MTIVIFGFCCLLSGLPQQSVLDHELRAFVEAWVDKDTPRLRDLLADGGIKLRLPEEEHLLLRPRQAQAALGAFLDEYDKGRIDVRRASHSEGNPEEGFAELLWSTRSPGVPEPVILTLFLAFSWQGERWAVTEIRILI